jgi:exodeoxyribonuclease (lambda-induced)
MRVVSCEQGSPAWLEHRCGKITASRVGDAIAVLKRKEGESAARAKYRLELITERLTGLATDHYVSSDMERGTELEPYARASYEVDREVMVDRVGLVLHPKWDYASASPDGLVGNDGGIEIKCGRITTHVEWMQAGVVPEEHRPQMYWNMLCCEREWWDFVSYHPRFKPWVVRLQRDEEIIKRMEDEVFKFNEEVDKGVRDLAHWVLPKSEEKYEEAPPIEQWAAEFDSMFPGDVTQ